MSGDELLVGKSLLKFLRWMLPISVITVVLMSGCNADTPDEHDAGSGNSRPYPSIRVNADAGTNVDEVAALSTASAIGFNDGKLSVSLDAIPLQQVLTEVSRLTGIDIQLIGEHSASTVNVQFSDSPLEKGLRRLLIDVNTIFVYADKGESPNHDGQLIKVLILPQGENSNVNVGMINVVESLSGLSQQIQNSIPLSYQDENANILMNDPLTGQALGELAETLGNKISSLGQAQKLKTGGAKK